MAQTEDQSSDRRIWVELDEKEMAAVNGWRKANAINSNSVAVRELTRLGLLLEIGRIYRQTASLNKFAPDVRLAPTEMLSPWVCADD